MSKNEIGKKFDEIVAFAEIEKFLDTPVRFYSSGMYVRLAFSVAAHLEPDVLILDEVLSVGDAAFQKKSLAKIMSIMESGATVLYVSHSMDTVRKICNRGILLEKGKIVFYGDAEELVDQYSAKAENEIKKNEKATKRTALTSWKKTSVAAKDDFFTLDSLILKDSSGVEIRNTLLNSENIFLEIIYTVKKTSPLLTVGFMFYNEYKTPLFVSASTDQAVEKQVSSKIGKNTFLVKIPKQLLNSGTFQIALFAGLHNKYWIYEPDTPQNPSVFITVELDQSLSYAWKQPRSGYIAPVLDWQNNAKDIK
jgi:lipopolysaccharide transport system ATP-binding protein